MSGYMLLAIAAVGAFLLLGGPATLRGVVGLLKPAHKCLPASDAQKIEMLMQLRDVDERFKGPLVRRSINHVIETLTGTADPEVPIT